MPSLTREERKRRKWARTAEAARKDLGLSKSALCERAGIVRQTYNTLADGYRTHQTTRAAVARALGLPEEDLLS